METAPGRVAPRRPSDADISLTLISGAVAIDTGAILANDVFHSTRHYISSAPLSAALVAPDYEFVGSMGLPQGSRIAFVRSRAGQRTKTLHVKDDLEGWTVGEIGPGGIELLHGEQRAELHSANASAAVGLFKPIPERADQGAAVAGEQAPLTPIVTANAGPIEGRSYHAPARETR